MKKLSPLARNLWLLCVFCAVFSPVALRAQVFIGGDFSVTFINGINVDLAPVVGYKYHGFSAGLSPFGMYSATGELSGEFSYGARLFAEYDVWKGLLVHLEGEVMNTGYVNQNGIKLRNWTYGIPLGVGYEYEISKGLWFKTMVLYDVLLDLNIDQNSPRANPMVRAGISYTF
jgi:hypothetical protein